MLEILELAVVILMYDGSCVAGSTELPLLQLVEGNVETGAEVVGNANLDSLLALVWGD